MKQKHYSARKRNSFRTYKVAESTHSNEGGNKPAANEQQTQQSEETAEERIVRKAYELAPEWKISSIAKKKFMALPSDLQNGAGKEACVKEALNGHKELIPDQTRYWIWMIDETRKLIRVWDFVETCEAVGRDPQTVAQHLILEGKMVCNAVRMEGLAAYGSNIRMFEKRLFQDEFKLFGNLATVKEAPVANDEEEEGANA